MSVPAWTVRDAARVLRRPTAADDKYSRGVLGVRTGSDRYPGAAVLGVEAAWRTGLGMVRYLGPTVPTSLVLHRRPETVAADGRVQAWLIGSGTDTTDRSGADTEVLRGVLSGELPVVVDAGALDLAPGARAPMILTPHGREHARIRALVGLADHEPTTDAERAASAGETAAALGATVVLKGSITVVATPSGWATAVSVGTSWLATAGTGDVLAGAIGAIVAGAVAGAEAVPGTEPADLGAAAATGVWLHGRAASLAARDLGAEGGPITALDVAEALPRAVAEALSNG
jgi:hydroxyethylthiazole kinase-like uncharacterized protein yjeF